MSNPIIMDKRYDTWLYDAIDLIRECRLADAYANRTGDEVRFDRAFDALCRFERQAARAGFVRPSNPA